MEMETEVITAPYPRDVQTGDCLREPDSHTLVRAYRVVV